MMTATAGAAEDTRQPVQLPDPMRAHMLANMRDHLAAMGAITRLLSEGRYNEAADVAETRLGMSSLETHGAEHMSRFMPDPMRAIGSEMHAAASRFAVMARDAEVSGELAMALQGLSQVMDQCVACHSAFRLRQ
jgi:urease accessory protein UreF